MDSKLIFPDKSDITCLIIAGGNSTRMGFDKGFLEVDGKQMIDHVIAICSGISDNIVISANNLEYKKFGYYVIEDQHKGLGPIGGLISALDFVKTKYAITIPIDTPFLNPLVYKILFEFIDDNKLVAAEYNGNQHPLFMMFEAEYMKSILPNIIASDKLKMRNLISEYGCFVDVENDMFSERTFLNINRKEDI